MQERDPSEGELKLIFKLDGKIVESSTPNTKKRRSPTVEETLSREPKRPKKNPPQEIIIDMPELTGHTKNNIAHSQPPEALLKLGNILHQLAVYNKGEDSEAKCPLKVVPREEQMIRLQQFNRYWWKRHKKGLPIYANFHLAAGFGKSLILVLLASLQKTLILVPNNVLIDQLYESIEKYLLLQDYQKLNIGIMKAEKMPGGYTIAACNKMLKESDITLATIQGLQYNDKYLQLDFSRIKLLTCDESHAMTSPARTKIIKHLQKKMNFQEYSATPTSGLTDAASTYNLVNEEGCEDLITEHNNPITPYSFRQGVDDGLLCPIVTNIIQLEEVTERLGTSNPKREKFAGEISRKRVASVFNKPRVNRAIANIYLNGRERYMNADGEKVKGKFHRGQQAIIYCAGIDHANAVAAVLDSVPIEQYDPDGSIRDAYAKKVSDDPFEQQQLKKDFQIAAAVVSKSKKKKDKDSTDKLLEDNKDLIERFKQGAISVFVSVDLLAIGFNVPAVSVIILARPWCSLIGKTQGIGRGNRLDPNDPYKILKVIDLISAKTNSLLTTELLSEDKKGFIFERGNVASCRQGQAIIEYSKIDVGDKVKGKIICYYDSEAPLFIGPKYRKNPARHNNKARRQQQTIRKKQENVAKTMAKLRTVLEALNNKWMEIEGRPIIKLPSHRVPVNSVQTTRAKPTIAGSSLFMNPHQRTTTTPRPNDGGGMVVRTRRTDIVIQVAKMNVRNINRQMRPNRRSAGGQSEQSTTRSRRKTSYVKTVQEELFDLISQVNSAKNQIQRVMKQNLDHEFDVNVPDFLGEEKDVSDALDKAMSVASHLTDQITDLTADIDEKQSQAALEKEKQLQNEGVRVEDMEEIQDSQTTNKLVLNKDELSEIRQLLLLLAVCSDSPFAESQTGVFISPNVRRDYRAGVCVWDEKKVEDMSGLSSKIMNVVIGFGEGDIKILKSLSRSIKRLIIHCKDRMNPSLDFMRRFINAIPDWIVILEISLDFPVEMHNELAKKQNIRVMIYYRTSYFSSTYWRSIDCVKSTANNIKVICFRNLNEGFIVQHIPAHIPAILFIDYLRFTTLRKISKTKIKFVGSTMPFTTKQRDSFLVDKCYFILKRKYFNETLTYAHGDRNLFVNENNRFQLEYKLDGRKDQLFLPQLPLLEYRLNSRKGQLFLPQLPLQGEKAGNDDLVTQQSIDSTQGELSRAVMYSEVKNLLSIFATCCSKFQEIGGLENDVDHPLNRISRINYFDGIDHLNNPKVTSVLVWHNAFPCTVESLPSNITSVMIQQHVLKFVDSLSKYVKRLIIDSKYLYNLKPVFIAKIPSSVNILEVQSTFPVDLMPEVGKRSNIQLMIYDDGVFQNLPLVAATPSTIRMICFRGKVTTKLIDVAPDHISTMLFMEPITEKCFNALMAKKNIKFIGYVNHDATFPLYKLNKCFFKLTTQDGVAVPCFLGGYYSLYSRVFTDQNNQSNKPDLKQPNSESQQNYYPSPLTHFQPESQINDMPLLNDVAQSELNDTLFDFDGEFPFTF